MREDTAYAYAVGRVRALETKLFGRTFSERLISSRSAREAVAMLSENGYPPYVDDSDASDVAGVSSVRRYIAALENFEADIIRQVASFSPQPELFDIMLLKYDYANAKICMKCELSGDSPSDLVNNCGTVKASVMISAFRDNNYAELPDAMRETLPEAVDDIRRTKSVRRAEMMLDCAYFTNARSVARKANKACTRAFLKEWLDLLADWTNITTFFRIRRIGGDKSLFEQAYIPSDISADFFAEGFGIPDEHLEEYLRSTPQSAALHDAISKKERVNSIAYIEKLADDAIMEYLIDNRRNVMGIEPLVAYITARQREITDVRIIILAKINEVQLSKVREKLRVTGA